MIPLRKIFINPRAQNVVTDTRFRQLLKDKNNRTLVEQESKLLFYDCGDISPVRDGPVFTGCKKLYIMNNDKNFNFYWIKKNRFPNVETIYFEGSTAEYCVYNRFSNSVWIAEEHARYFPKEVQRVTSNEFMSLLVKEGFTDNIESAIKLLGLGDCKDTVNKFLDSNK